MAPQSEKSSEKEPLDFEDMLWQIADKLRGSMNMNEDKDIVLRLIFLKYITDAFQESRRRLCDKLVDDGITGKQADKLLESPDEYAAAGAFWVPPEARWDYLCELTRQADFGILIDRTIDLIKIHSPDLNRMIPKTHVRSHLNGMTLGELVDLISSMGPVAFPRSEKDVYDSASEYLRRFASEDTSGGAFYTPHSAVQCLVKMIEPYSGRVYDPCCGSGGMFMQAERSITARGGHRGNIAAHGQEFDDMAWRLTKMNTVLHGIEADLGPRSGSSLSEDMHPSLKADYILTNPPFNVSGWNSGQLHDDARWEYGVPPASNANFAWLQHIVSHLSPRGMAAVVLPDGTASTQRRREAEIRRRMIEADLIECVVALPEHLFHSTQIPVTVWILNRDKAQVDACHRRDRQGETLFIDARRLGVMVDRTHRKLTNDDVALIADTYQAWHGESGAGSYVDVPGFCSSATTREIAEHQYVLTPCRYVGGGDDERLYEAIIRLTEDVRSAGWQVSRLADFLTRWDYLRSEKAPERAAKIAEFRREERLVLPVEAHLDAAYGAVPDVIVRNRCLLVALAPQINGFFVAAWLNSDDGRRIRAAAMPGTDESPRTVSQGNLRRFLKGLVVPAPSPDVQFAIAETIAVLDSVRQRTGQLATELWRSPSLAAEIQAATQHWLDSTLLDNGPET